MKLFWHNTNFSHFSHNTQNNLASLLQKNFFRSNKQLHTKFDQKHGFFHPVLFFVFFMSFWTYFCSLIFVPEILRPHGLFYFPVFVFNLNERLRIHATNYLLQHFFSAHFCQLSPLFSYLISYGNMLKNRFYTRIFFNPFHGCCVVCCYISLISVHFTRFCVVLRTGNFR